jgi:hypothetical protein
MKVLGAGSSEAGLAFPLLLSHNRDWDQPRSAWKEPRSEAVDWTTFWNSDNEDNTASAAAMKGGPKFPWEKAHLTVVLHRFRYGWNGLLALNTGRE